MAILLISATPAQGAEFPADSLTVELDLNASEGSSSLRIEVDGIQVFDGTSWTSEYSGSSIGAGGEGVDYRVTLVKGSNWIPGPHDIVIKEAAGG